MTLRYKFESCIPPPFNNILYIIYLNIYFNIYSNIFKTMLFNSLIYLLFSSSVTLRRDCFFIFNLTAVVTRQPFHYITHYKFINV